MTRTVLDRASLAGESIDVAPFLLNKLLVSTVGDTTVSGRIVEVEAYDQSDPASHSYRGPTNRTRTMFGPPGHLYVYLSYGIHHCANVVTSGDGRGAAVLLRAVVPVEGIDTIRLRRAGRPDREFANGPGKLCAAFAIAGCHDGVDVCQPISPVSLIDDGVAPPCHPVVGPRIGITKAVERPWRFRVSE